MLLVLVLLHADPAPAAYQAAAAPPALDIAWDTPTHEPSRNAEGLAEGHPMIGGGMPVGNGETALLVFPLAPHAHGNGSSSAPNPNLGGFQLPNSVSFLVNMATAMASDTSLFKLGMVSLVTALFLEPDAPPLTSFEQRLDAATATVTITGTSAAGDWWIASVAVDATSNTITALLNTSTPVPLEVVVQSLHPPGRFPYYSKAFPGAMSEPDRFASLQELKL